MTHNFIKAAIEEKARKKAEHEKRVAAEKAKRKALLGNILFNLWLIPLHYES